MALYTNLLPSSYVATTATYGDVLADITEDPYINSLFLPIKTLSSKKKGAVFEKFVDEICTKNGHRVLRPDKSTAYDRLIDGKRVEIKGSFLWGKGTHFRWQQIRTAQDYDYVLFLAFYPDRLELYTATSDVVKENLEVQDEKGNWTYNQHGGKKVNSGAFVIDGYPEDFPWMKPAHEIL